MGFPQEGHAPHFSRQRRGQMWRQTQLCVATIPQLLQIIGEQKVLVVSSSVRSKGLLLAAKKPQRLYLQGQGLDLFHKDLPQWTLFSV